MVRLQLPLEPQDATDLHLPDLSYFPIIVNGDYEVPDDQTTDPQTDTYFDEVGNGMVFQKT